MRKDITCPLLTALIEDALRYQRLNQQWKIVPILSNLFPHFPQATQIHPDMLFSLVTYMN